MSSRRPVGTLACPARFELAAWALEALKMRLNNIRNNGFKVLLKVWHKYREPWCWVGLGGSGLASAGGRIAQCGNVSG
jgi:hypothetical protein